MNHPHSLSAAAFMSLVLNACGGQRETSTAGATSLAAASDAQESTNDSDAVAVTSASVAQAPTPPASSGARVWDDETQPTIGGAKGPGLTGIGEGATGGEGIGLGTPSNGRRSAPGQTGSAGATKVHPPPVVMGATPVTGQLPPEVIRHSVRQSFSQFRACYEKGLLVDPKLEGTVTVSFTIGRDGKVGSVSAGSSLPSPEVVSCVVRAFGGVTFAKPEGGIVVVRYPIHFSPG